MHSNKEQPSWIERNESGSHIALQDAQLHFFNVFFGDEFTTYQEYSAFRA